jgi:hypothetical protein
MAAIFVHYEVTPSTLMIELTATGYVALGTQSAVAVREARIALLDAANCAARVTPPGSS